MIKCKACGGDMPLTEVKDHPGNYEICCDRCIKEADFALTINEWDFEGLYWEHDVNNRGDLHG